MLHYTLHHDPLAGGLPSRANKPLHSHAHRWNVHVDADVIHDANSRKLQHPADLHIQVQLQIGAMKCFFFKGLCFIYHADKYNSSAHFGLDPKRVFLTNPLWL